MFNKAFSTEIVVTPFECFFRRNIDIVEMRDRINASGDVGWGYVRLVGAIKDDRWKHCPVSVEGSSEAKFRGSVENFTSKFSSIEHHMKNLVKVCPSCKKSCAKSSDACNNCKTNLSDQPLQVNPNVLMAFVYGIERFVTSIRYQDDSFLVYDDLMQTTLIHLNAVPTEVYVPDFRYLLGDPERGLALIYNLFKVSVHSASKMLADRDFANKFFSPNAVIDMQNASLADFIEYHVHSGFNFPPSQNQLHLQFILPPFTPYHAVLSADGGHTQINRFFPFDVVIAYLKVLVESKQVVRMQEIRDLSGSELIEFLEQRTSVEYYKMFYEEKERSRRSECFLANWNSSDFQYLAVGKTMLYDMISHKVDAVDSAQLRRMHESDNETITSFGKGPRGLQYYAFAKDPGCVRDWNSDVLLLP